MPSRPDRRPILSPMGSVSSRSPRSALTFLDRSDTTLHQNRPMSCGKNATSRWALPRPPATFHPTFPHRSSCNIAPASPPPIVDDRRADHAGWLQPPCTRRLPNERSHATHGVEVTTTLPYSIQRPTRTRGKVSQASYRPSTGIATIPARRTRISRTVCTGLNAMRQQTVPSESAFLSNEVVLPSIRRLSQ